MSDYTIEKHTPIDGDFWLVFKNGALYAKVYSDENARRIVACVNACEGIRTETLERVKLADAGDIQDALRDCLDQMERTPKSAVSPDFIAAIDDGRKALGES